MKTGSKKTHSSTLGSGDAYAYYSPLCCLLTSRLNSFRVNRDNKFDFPGDEGGHVPKKKTKTERKRVSARVRRRNVPERKIGMNLCQCLTYTGVTDEYNFE